MFEHNEVDRRTFLRLGGVAAAALGTGSLLSACGGSGGNGSGGQAANTSILPTYIPYPDKPKPDLPGDPNGLAEGFLSYPKNPKAVTSKVPGDGSDVSAMVITYDPVVPGVSSNQYWQQVNKRLGVDLKIQQIPSGDYQTKVQTATAGDDIPDFVQFQQQPPSFPDLLKAKFTDLTPYLSGDNVKQYPFLANIPQYFWSTSVMYNGGIYGIPIAAYRMVNYVFTRDDILADLGLKADFTDWDGFVSLCKQVNDPSKSRWAIDHVIEPTATRPAGLFSYALQCLGVANGFSVKDGQFASYHTDPRTKDAIDACAKLVKAGYVYPDAFSQSTTDWVTDMAVGKAVIGMPGGLTSLPRFFNLSVDPKMKIGGVTPVKFDSSSEPHPWQRTPAFSITAVKKGSDDRIKMLLEIANYLAAPFGSEEYLFINFGIKGTDWTYDKNGEPATTPKGKSETLGFGLPYIACPPRVLYTPGLAGPTKTQWELEKKMMPTSIADATLGLYSETYGRKWNQLERAIGDVQSEIMKGNQPISAWDDAVKTWKSSGGDQIISEYNQAYASNHK